MDLNGRTLTFDGATWSRSRNAVAKGLLSVSCPSSSFCMAVTASGHDVTFDGMSWSTPMVWIRDCISPLGILLVRHGMYDRRPEWKGRQLVPRSLVEADPRVPWRILGHGLRLMRDTHELHGREQRGNRRKLLSAQRRLGCGYGPFWHTDRRVPWKVAHPCRLVAPGAPK